MSLFRFNFGATTSSQRSDEDKENRTERVVADGVRPPSMSAGVGQRTPLFNFGSGLTTPTDRSVFGNRVNQSAGSQQIFGSAKDQKCFPSISDKKFGDDLKTKSSVKDIADESNALKNKILEELERIETFKELTQLDISRKIEEIKELKDNVMDLENRITVLNGENSDLKVKINGEHSERQDLIKRMANTRDMVLKVKNAFDNIEYRMGGFAAAKKEMEDIDTERTQHMREMAKDFDNLAIRHKSIVSEFKTDFNSLKTDLKTKDKELIREKEIRNELNLNLEALKKKVLEGKQTIQMIDSELTESKQNNQNLGLALDGLKAEKNDLTEKLSEIKTISASKDLKIEELSQSLCDMNDKIKEYETETEEFGRKEEEMKTKMNELNDAIAEKSSIISSEMEKLKKVMDENQDLQIKIQSIDENISEISVQNTVLTETVEEMEAKVTATEAIAAELETSLQSKTSLIQDLEKTREELDSSLESLRAENHRLIQSEEQNQSLIEELTSKANESLVEKERTEEKLTKDLEDLKLDFNQKMTELTEKISQLESRIQELNHLREENETTICVLHSEKEALELKRREEVTTLEKKHNEMKEILASVKSDYRKRMDEKENQIRRMSREFEKKRERHHKKEVNSIEPSNDVKEEPSDEPKIKRPKQTLVPKAYGKSQVKKEKPTPTKQSDDLSWIDFD